MLKVILMVMLPWLQQNWLALCGFGISVLAFTLSYRRFKHDTRPALILRGGSEGTEIENVGQVVAVGVALTLVERVKRPSGKLGVADILRPGEKATVRAFDWPEAVAAELERNTLSSTEEFVRRMDGQKVRPDGRRVASYLLSREGKRIVILRFRAVDGSKTSVRLFRSVKGKLDEFTTLRPSYRLFRNRIWAAAVEKLYSGNAEIAPPLPPFEFPLPESGKALEEGPPDCLREKQGS